MTIAFVPVAFGYGTTVRCLAIARELRRRGHETVFLAGPSVRPMIRRHGYPVRLIPDVSIQPKPGEPTSRQLFAQESAPGFLARQLAAIERSLNETRADLVVYSNSMTAALAASHLDLPSISVFSPSILEVSAPSHLAPMLGTWLRFLLLRARTPLTRPVPSAFLGDRSFIPSVPPLIRWPALVPPGLARHRSEVEPCGALLTRPPAALPPRGVLLQELGVDGSPFVYATVGGAVFSVDVVREVAQGIRGAGCRGLVSGGRILSEDVSRRLSDERVQVVSFVPDDLRAIAAADVLIWHGGHQTMMEAVACGTPAVGLPFQLDQFANVASLVEFGAALSLSARDLRADRVTTDLRRVLDEPSFRDRMTVLRQVNAGYGGAGTVADAAEELLGERGKARIA